MRRDDKGKLLQYRLDRANESLKAAELLIDNELLIPAMNRIYYSMFYAVGALLVLRDANFSKHGQVKGFFNREFIKTEIFPVKFGKLFNTVFEYRQKYDYVDLIYPDDEMLSDYLSEAQSFIDTVSSFIESNFFNN